MKGEKSLAILDEIGLLERDLETGCVVTEYDFKDNQKILDITNESRYSQTSFAPTLIGVTENSLCALDTRTPGVIQNISGKT
jgi:hypothetical protein